ncbi:MAG: TonB-dependent receptor [Undibacterium sp.]|nr:TonB-dependent receptor [Undibacterium sp.]
MPPLNKILIAIMALPSLAYGQSINSTVQSGEDLALAYGDRATISIATGSAQSLRRAPAVATVITAEDIAAMGLHDLNEALETVPGLHVNTTPTTYASSYSIRGIGVNGASNPQVLILQNGIPLIDIYNGDKGNSWVSMPLTNVSRIEVIRGPGSALYGADAFAGVINIITKSAAEISGTRLGVRLGSFRSVDTWIQHGGKLADITVAAYLQLGKTDGQKSLIDQDAQSLNDKRFGTHVSLAPGPVNTEYRALDSQLDLSTTNWRWRSSYKIRKDIGFGAGVNSALDPNHHNESNRFTSDLSWSSSQLADDWNFGGMLSFMRIVEQTPQGIGLFPPGTRIGASYFPDGMIGGPGRWQRTVSLSGFATYNGWRGHAIRIGAGHDDLNLYRTETIKNFLLSPAGLPIPTGAVKDYNAIQPHILPQRRQIDYVYLQDEWQLLPDWIVTAGVRHDRYDDFGHTTNPRLALVWDASVDLTAKLLTGRAFRTPSFNEQYGINPVNSGNPLLQPETITTHELVLNWQANYKLGVNLNFFDYQSASIIRSVANPAPAPGASYRNVGQVNGHGAELELNWELSETVRGSLQHAWQRANDPQNGSDPSLTPRHHTFAKLSWQIEPSVLFSSQINRVAGRQRSSGDARPAIPDYTTVDLTLSTKYGGWEFALNARNLFNADVREPSLAPGLALPHDLPMAPRALTLQFSHKL